MPPENKENDLPHDPMLKQIRTFQGDVADALHRQKESLVSIQQTEAVKRRQSPDEVVESEIARRRKNAFFLFIGSLFFITLGIFGAWYGYQEYLRKTAPPPPTAPANRLIAPEDEVSVDISGASRETLLSKFTEAIMNVPEGKLKHVVLRNGSLADSALLTTSELFNILESKASGSLVRSFAPIFMIGALGQDPFLIIELVSFENTYAGMLAWEPNMPADIAPMLGTGDLLKVISPAYVFRDMIVKNKDVRLLEASSTPVMLYSFLDNQILIITEDLETLQTLIDRLTREKLSR